MTSAVLVSEVVLPGLFLLVSSIGGSNRSAPTRLMGYDAARMSGLKKTDPVRIALQRQRQIDAAAAMAEYHAATAAELEKAARLKALRLARELSIAEPSRPQPS